MTSYAWNGVSGDWDDPNDWTPAGGPPTSADDATISGSPSADIITVDTADAANALTLSDANATLDIDGAGASLSVDSLVMSAGGVDVSSSRDGGLLALNGGTLNLKGGRLTLGRDGTISDGTIDSAGGVFNWRGGTLDDVTIHGLLNLVEGRAGYVTNGLTGLTVSGIGSELNVDDGAYLFFDGAQTISNTVIELGVGGGDGYAHLRETDTAGVGNQVLTVASNALIQVLVQADISSGSASGDGIVNDGTISVYAAEGLSKTASLVIDPTTFVNNGTIEVGFGGNIYIRTAVTGTGTDVIYAGTLQFDAGVSTAATLGDQNIEFAGPSEPGAGSAVLRLLDSAPTSFYGEISGFAAGDEINLAGDWAFSGISEAGGLTTLTLSNGSTSHGFEFVGDYTQSNFSFHTQHNGVTAITYA